MDGSPLEVRYNVNMKQLKGLKLLQSGTGGLVLEQTSLPLPPKVVLPLDSPMGSVQAVVRPGDFVQEGQRIAQDDKGILPDVRTSISGTVSEIRSWPGPFGRDSLSVVIESNGESGNTVRLYDEGRLPQNTQTQLKLIAEAGIREADDFPWPLSVRIAQPALTPPILFPFVPDLRRPIDYLILNGMDRQPGVWVRSCALRTMEKEILEGVPILKALSGAEKTILVLPKGEVLSESLERGLRMAGVEVVYCPDQYPNALEPVLVKNLTGREIPQPGGDARTVGTVVVDVITIGTVARTVFNGVPPVDVLVQVSAPSQWIHSFIRVREGTLLKDALEHISAVPKNPGRVITRGPFLGHAMYDMNVPLLQQTEAVIFQGPDDFTPYQNEPCINCGLCVRSCPMRLFPNELSRECEYGRFEEAEGKDLFRCIECGICSFVCPVRRPMIHLIRFGKSELSALREER